jgi:hypothetical protein
MRHLLPPSPRTCAVLADVVGGRSVEEVAWAWRIPPDTVRLWVVAYAADTDAAVKIVSEARSSVSVGRAEPRCPWQ